MIFFRIYCESKDSWIQDCDDDGETAAGGRLLHLLQVCVIVYYHCGFLIISIQGQRHPC